MVESVLIDVACPSCGETYHVSEAHAGRRLQCRKCGHIFEITVPSAATTAANGAAPSGAAPVEVTDADFATTVLGSPLPVLVDFWAAWCGPCRAISPVVEQLAADYAGRVKFAKLDADQNPQTMSRFGVMGLPTLVLFKGGREAARLVGLQPKAAIKQAVERALAG